MNRIRKIYCNNPFYGGEVITVHKKVYDSVKFKDQIYSIENDEFQPEICSEYDGILLDLVTDLQRPIINSESPPLFIRENDYLYTIILDSLYHFRSPYYGKGEISRVYKSIGDTVFAYQPLLQIKVDNVHTNIVSEFNGELVGLHEKFEKDEIVYSIKIKN